ncbi:MAG: hypothetical protein CEE43_02530 [Promethearchaeota archaeon Loki_b32]|nr:MAG: hypothetical protein CEE43_02530 [Candidatus Lokiarchaeota archaeon Loki_b32]
MTLKFFFNFFNYFKYFNILILLLEINSLNMKTKVYVIKRKSHETIQAVVLRILKMIPLKELITNSEKKIIINPNWVTSEHFTTGNITSTDTLEGIVIYLIQEAKIDPEKLIVGDGGSFGIAEEFFKLNEIIRLKDYGIKIMDLNNDEIVNDIEIPNPLSLKTVNIVKTAMEASCIISVPSLKTHNLARTTLSMKNMMGTIMPKSIMHSSIHKKITDLVSVLRPKMKFQIIDAIIESDGWELGGKPIQMDLIIAGEDPVAVDRVGSEIIGFGWDKVKYLKYGEKKQLGIADLDEIEIVGKSINEVYYKF